MAEAGVGGGPAGEGRGHVTLWGVGSVDEGFLSGHRTPGVVEFAEFGRILGEVGDIFTHETGVLGREVFEHFGEGEAPGDGAFGSAEFFAQLGDVGVAKDGGLV